MKQQEGYVLVTVLFLVVLLATLGAAYVVAMNFEVRSSHVHDHATQAYYYARSGVEVGLNWLFDNGSIRDDFTVGNDAVTLYVVLQRDHSFSLSKTPPAQHSSRVTIESYEEGGDTVITLAGEGRFGTREEVVHRELRRSDDGLGGGPEDGTISAEKPVGIEGEDYEDAVNIHWIGSSGTLNKDVDEESALPIVFQDMAGYKIIRTQGYAYFKAPELYFDADVKVNPHGDLQLTAEKTVFFGMVDMKENNTRLCFHLYPGATRGYVIFYNDLVHDGEVLFSAKDGPLYLIYEESVCLPDGREKLRPLSSSNGNEWDLGIWF